jgi:hypothetical protein
VKSKSPSEIDRIFEEGRPIDLAMVRAAEQALRVHKQAGIPLVMCRGDQTEFVSPEDFERALQQAEQRHFSKDKKLR